VAIENLAATNRRVRAGVTASAVLMAILGGMLLFAPGETSGWLIAGTRDEVIAQLLGAALLGFAAANWIARRAALGGIYGRAIVAGNHAHVTIGAVVLVKYGLGRGTQSGAFWVVTALYVLGAVFFNYLLFFSSGLRPPATKG